MNVYNNNVKYDVYNHDVCDNYDDEVINFHLSSLSTLQFGSTLVG